MVVFGLAGLLKFADLIGFAADLQAWRLLPRAAQSLGVVAVPAIEVALALFWFVGMWARTARRGAIAVLVVWTTAYAVEALAWGPPRCGCFGRIQHWYLFRDALPWVVARNVLLCALLGVGTDPPWSLPRVAPQRKATAGVPVARGAAAGFTLIETLLVIALVGVLFSLALPSLNRVRQSAKSVQALADLRTHATMVAAYGADFKELFPCIADPRFTDTIIQTPDGRVRLAYFDQRFLWWVGVAESYYGGVSMSPTFFAPYRNSSGRGPPYWYALGCVARPEYWDPATRRSTGQIGIMKISDTLYPAKKGLFVNWDAAFRATGDFFGREIQGVPVETAFVDGSASVVRSEAFRPPVPDGEGPRAWPFVRMNVGIPVVHTVHGVRGRDVQ